MSDFEITVRVNMKLEDLFTYLNENNFIFHQSFRCIDIFMIKKEQLVNKITLNDLNNCIILRKLIFKDKTLKYMVIKNKEYEIPSAFIQFFGEECYEQLGCPMLKLYHFVRPW